MATIRESVQEELVFIGTAEKHLRFAVGKRITQPAKFLCGAEKAAVECGYRLEVSWATTLTPEAHKAALTLAYEEQHDGRRPGFKRPDTGDRVKGVKLIISKHGIADRDLAWSDWMPMNDATIPRIPEELGVYRVCAVWPADADRPEPKVPEVVDTTDALNRVPVEEFIREVPRWHAKYMEGNMCVFKVEAFVQRDWDNPCLDEPVCKEKYPQVENLIEGLKGKDDLIKPEHDIEVVYRWGGGLGHRLFSQIINGNPPIEKVREQTKTALSTLEEGRPVEALEQLKRLRWCSDAFGSKVLAMRSPKDAPIWDNIAQHCLREFRIGGKKVGSYAQFIRFCEHIADELKAAGVAPPLGCDGRPREVDGRWYLRDIEMAIFQFGWCNGKFDGRITGQIP